MLLVNTAEFQKLAAQVAAQGHADLPGVTLAVLENDKIQIVDGEKILAEFSRTEALEALLRCGQQAAVPTEADCYKMMKSAGIKKAAKAPSPEAGKKGNV